MERAIKHRWNIDPRVYEVLPGQMAKLAIDANTDERVRINAARVLTYMHGQNQDDDREPAKTIVNVQTNLAVIPPHVAALTDDDLDRRIADLEAVEKAAAVGGPPPTAPAVADPLPAHTNGAANGVSHKPKS